MSSFYNEEQVSQKLVDGVEMTGLRCILLVNEIKSSLTRVIYQPSNYGCQKVNSLTKWSANLLQKSITLHCQQGQ